MNEFLFLSERVADLYMHLGDFASAETALLSASNLIKGAETQLKPLNSDAPHSKGPGSIRSAFNRSTNPRSPPTPEHLDSRYLGLQLRLAKVMLAGCDRERGILLLTTLSKTHQLSATSSLQIHKLLACGLYQVDRTREALAVIKQTRTAMQRLLLPADKFWLVSLEARCLLRAGETKPALKVLDLLLQTEHRVSALAHLYVLRGRTLFACARSGLPHNGTSGSTAATASDAADAFFSAWELYRTVGNRVPEAKAAARFVEAKLWTPGALTQNKMWDEASGTPRMGPARASPFASPVLQRTRPGSMRGGSLMMIRSDSQLGGTTSPVSWKRQTSDPAREQSMDPDSRASVEKAAVLALEMAVTSCGELRLLLRAQMNLAGAAEAWRIRALPDASALYVFVSWS